MIHLSSLRPGNLSIYKNTEGTIEKLTDGGGFDHHPIPTPDGKGVIFSGSENGSHHLFMLADGKRVKLTDHPLFEDHARFDQEGNLYFTSDFDGSAQIYRVRWKGMPIRMSDAEKITSGPGNCFSFAVSSNGKELIFSSNRENQSDYMGPQPDENFHAGQLYRMQIGNPGTCRRLLGIEGSHWEGTPEYSPDEKSVVFYSNHEGEPRLYRYHFKLGAVDCLWDKPSAYPVFEENGGLLFSAKGKNRWKIRRISSDGSQVQTVAKLNDDDAHSRYFSGESSVALPISNFLPEFFFFRQSV